VETCFFQHTPTEFLVDFIISIIAHLSDEKDSQSLKTKKVIKKMEAYLGERQHQMKSSDILKQRMGLRKVPPKDLKDGLIKFGEEQDTKRDVKKDIAVNLEIIRAAAMKAKGIDIPLVTDLFIVEDCLESDQPVDPAMKSVLEKLLLKHGEDEYWLKSIESAIEMVGWMQLKGDEIVDILKKMINDTKQPLSLQVYAAEALFKLHTGNKDGNISC
jgi:hypothetical protein